MPSQEKLSRRSLLALGAFATAARAARSIPLPAQKVESKTFVPVFKVPSRQLAQRPALQDIRLQDKLFSQRFERNKDYVLSLDPDRFLHYFHTTAGLPAKADVYPGWELKVGRMLGHYLSACSMYEAATGEPGFQQRQQYVVRELAACQRANGDGYVGGVPEAKRIFAEIGAGKVYLEKGNLNGVHAPWYMLHKMSAGLRDAYAYTGNQEALTVLVGFSNWADGLTSKLSEADMQTMLQDEHGGVNEVFADVYAFTGEPRYLELSRRFNRKVVLGPLMEGTDDLNGLHANTQIPPIVGLQRQYEVSGDENARKGAQFFWQNVVNKRSYAIGGDSDAEHFYPIGRMGAKLTAVSAETCNSYNMVKLTDRLMSEQPNEELAAFNERVLWNHILASQDPNTVGVTYYMSLKPGHFKLYSSPYESFWCCVGTGMENHAKYGESLYSTSADSLWCHQFIASELKWQSKGMRIQQRTSFPLEQRSEWQVNCAKPVQATINIRQPRWAGDGFKLALNGKPVKISEPGSYVSITRTWRTGDKITAELPMHPVVESMNDDPGWKAIVYGPIVLVGVVPGADLPPGAPYAKSSCTEYVRTPDPAVPELKLADAEIGKWLKPNGVMEFTGESTAGPLQFRPLYAIAKERYSVYWKLASQASPSTSTT